MKKILKAIVFYYYYYYYIFFKEYDTEFENEQKG